MTAPLEAAGQVERYLSRARKWLAIAVARRAERVELRDGKDVLGEISADDETGLSSLIETGEEHATDHGRAIYLQLVAVNDETSKPLASFPLRLRPAVNAGHNQAEASALETMRLSLEGMAKANRELLAAATTNLATVTNGLGSVLNAMSQAVTYQSARAGHYEAKSAKLESQASELLDITSRLEQKLREAEEGGDDLYKGVVKMVVEKAIEQIDLAKVIPNGVIKTPPTITVKAAKPE